MRFISVALAPLPFLVSAPWLACALSAPASPSRGRFAFKNRTQKLDVERQRQQELLYAVEFQSQLMQRKVARVAGERSTDEAAGLHRDIDRLTQASKEQTANWSYLKAQLKQLQNEMRASERAKSDLAQSEKTITAVLEEQKLELAAVDRALVKGNAEKEQLLVVQNKLNFELEELQRKVCERTERLRSLQRQNEQLRLSLQEVMVTVDDKEDLLVTERRLGAEQRRKVAVELAERKTKIANLQAKFETIIQKSEQRDGEEEGRSQAYYLIKAAQEQEELQRQGDQLDALIVTAERELASLDKTLSHLRQRSDRARVKHVSGKNPATSQAHAKERLERDLRELNDKIFSISKANENLQVDIQSSSKQLQIIQSSNNDCRENVQALADEESAVSAQAKKSAALAGATQRSFKAAQTAIGEDGRDVIRQLSSTTWRYSQLYALKQTITQVLTNYPDAAQQFTRFVDGQSRPTSGGAS
eukprot:GHVT01007751.1.p1 GENE.GHVT01007751.1~~GHVT01007751.1.p1  ORF type:complete len:475 (+),score=95.54 GHVT01007751.1:504-1928(+)